MWVAVKTGFISLVEHRENRGFLLARARRREDLADSFPELAEMIEEDLTADYAFRLPVPRSIVSQFLDVSVQRVDYTSHVKEELAGKDDVRYSAYLGVWSALGKLQEGGPYSSGKWSTKDWGYPEDDPEAEKFNKMTDEQYEAWWDEQERRYAEFDDVA